MQFPRETLPDFSERVMATSLSEGGLLFNIEKLNGTNFPFWKEQIYNVLGAEEASQANKAERE